MSQTTNRASARLRGGWAVLATVLMLATAGATSATGTGVNALRTTDVSDVVRETAPAALENRRAPSEAGNDAPVEARPAPRTLPAIAVARTLLPRPAVVIHTRLTAAPIHRAVVVAQTYSGRNHMWMPSLGINRTVYTYPCSRATPPDKLVYRWGCAGTNNVYLLGHAWGVFQPLHDAYVQGRLRVGMEVIYADGTGRIRHYRITTWRVVLPTDGSWIGSMPSPTVILQTCIGATSAYRLNVKLVAID
jgi:hypothetical protein